MAMLRGMGWSEGMGVGRNRKVCPPGKGSLCVAVGEMDDMSRSVPKFKRGQVTLQKGVAEGAVRGGREGGQKGR